MPMGPDTGPVTAATQVYMAGPATVASGNATLVQAEEWVLMSLWMRYALAPA